MKKLFFLSLCSIMLVCSTGAWAIESNTKGVAPVNFYTVQDFNNTNKYIFDCDFSKIEKSGEKARPYCIRFCPDNTSCTGLNADNYFSYFIPFNYQYLPVMAYDYAINLFRYLEKSEANAEKVALNSAFSNNTNNSNVKTSTFASSLSLNKFVPYTFALEGLKKGSFHVFIPAKDVLLRNKIYPTLKILSLKKPENSAETNTISKYAVVYSVYPQAYEVRFDDDWVSYLLGVPLYKDAKYNIEATATYFDEVTKGASSIDFNAGSAVTPAENARPFDFEAKLANPDAYGKNSLRPAINSKNDGLINEYLPYYELEKVEIIKQSANGNETTIQIYDKNAINALIANPDESAGFMFSAMKEDGDKVSVRFTHKVKSPRLLNMGVIRSTNTGLRDIFGTLSAVFVSDLNVNKFYDLKKLPSNCLVKAQEAGLLDGKKSNGYDIKSLKETLKDNSSVCDPRETLMIKIILTKDLL